MISTGALYPQRSQHRDAVTFGGTFIGAGAADLVSGVVKGITSVAYASSTGKFTVTVPASCVGYALLDVDVKVHTGVGVAPLLAKYVPASFSPSAGTVSIEFWDLATPSLADPPSGCVVSIYITMTKAPG